MKKIIALLAIVSLAFLASCGKQEANIEVEATTETTVEATTEEAATEEAATEEETPVIEVEATTETTVEMTTEEK